MRPHGLDMVLDVLGNMATIGPLLLTLSSTSLLTISILIITMSFRPTTMLFTITVVTLASPSAA